MRGVGRSKEVNTPQLIGQTVRVTYVEVLKGVQEEIPSEEASTLSNRVSGISTRTMHQSTNSILVTDYFDQDGHSKQFLSLPYSPDLAPCDFSLFRKLRGLSLWDNWGDERGCDEGHLTHSHKRTSMGTLLEVVWNRTVQQVHCTWRRSLRRGTRVSCVYYQ